jgi:hypothetical protein
MPPKGGVIHGRMYADFALDIRLRIVAPEAPPAALPPAVARTVCRDARRTAAARVTHLRMTRRPLTTLDLRG